jgi:type I restriction enzyme M protein
MSAEFDEEALYNVCRHMRNDQMIISEYIDQLSGLLFLKACEESPRINQDELNIPESARWNRLVSDEVRRNNSLVDVYDEIIEELQTDGKLAREAYNNFTNGFDSDTTLKNTVDDIENLDFWDRYEGYADFFGDAYEYLLEEYADKADGAGEYFTPRPLIRAMVEVVDPEYEETVYDPASGTNGFLIESYKHVGKKTAGEISGEEQNFVDVPDDGPDSFAEQLTGRDITRQTYRLGLMNLILHDIDPTEMDITRGNSITREVDQEYDVVLANPPYGGNGSDKFPDAWAESNAPETNFLQLIMRSLSEDGHAGVIVPEGILFRGDADKSVRERLLDRYNLDCILVLPENSFHPYAGVDANVLFFERDSDGTQEVWYYDMRTNVEGIKESNPLTYEHFDEFISSFDDTECRKEADRFFKVPTGEVEENDYELNYNQYREYATGQYRSPKEVAGEIKEELEKIENSLDVITGGIDDDL